MRKSANAKQEFIKTVTWNNKDLKEGATLDGYFISVEGFEGQYGETTKYIIEAGDGTCYGVYGTASLDRQFKKIPEGCYVWITYEGVVTSKNGRQVKQFTVDYDDELTK